MRKQITYTVTDEGRDKGKTYQLTEMPAAHAEKFAVRLLLAAGRSGADIPPGIENDGIAGLKKILLVSLLKLDPMDAEPLLDEMMRCVSFIPSASQPNIIRGISDGDIEEVATLFKLRREIFRLHAGF